MTSWSWQSPSPPSPRSSRAAADGSATADLAAALPQSHVLKAFNTNFAATLASGTAGEKVSWTGGFAVAS